MTRKPAVVLVTAYLSVLTFVVACVASAAQERVVGYGQVKFRGAGPEKWALRFRRERRQVRSLRQLLAKRLPRIVYLVDSFQCIHRGEGGWSANTGNGYYGGLQMDVGFQRTYAPDLLRSKGTADRWTPAEQMATAIVAHGSRGFYPWPNTARACGLIR
jgi:hypothetical protein